MSNTSVSELVRECLVGVSLGLYEGITTGFANARGVGSHLDQSRFRWLLAMNARAHMRLFWESNPPAPGWSVGGDARLMGQTILVSADQRLTLRLLKENHRVHPAGVPPAGHNAARQAAFSQLPLPGLDFASGVAIEGTTNCLLVWDAEWEHGDPMLSVRVVHPIGTGSYGQPVPIDLSIDIDPSGELYDHLRFGGHAEDVDLFPTFRQEENEDGIG